MVICVFVGICNACYHCFDVLGARRRTDHGVDARA
jgi:hypothetical protein